MEAKRATALLKQLEKKRMAQPETPELWTTREKGLRAGKV